MRRHATAALTLLLAVGTLSACAEFTTTGAPSEDTGLTEGIGESLAPEVDALSGTAWKLSGSSADSLDLASFPVTADFSEGKLSGKGPVNTYTTSYEVEDDAITLGAIASTRMAGSDEAMAAEGAYFALLSTVNRFEIDGDTLELLADEEPVLDYEARDPLTEQLAATQEFADELVGSKTAEAQAAAEKAGYTFRVISEDGEGKPATSDLRADRVNATIEDGVVTEATAG